MTNCKRSHKLTICKDSDSPGNRQSLTEVDRGSGPRRTRWRRYVTKCVYVHAGRIKVKVKVKVKVEVKIILAVTYMSLEKV